uniref:Uncharacterized protein n=1 Tax=Oryza sativa subsp. japonica TaxID=39947 RepID=Q8H5V8_ORYSJ|nr:hypothetical protein [Oryza sativa Japonica Group]
MGVSSGLGRGDREESVFATNFGRGSTDAPDLMEEEATATGTGRQLGLCLELEDDTVARET